MSRKIKIILFILLFAFCNSSFYLSATSASSSSVSSIRSKINQYQKKQAVVQQQLQTDQANLHKTNVQIGTTKTVISQTVDNISQCEDQISQLNNNIDFNKTILGSYLREAYYVDQDPTAEIVVADASLADVTNNFNVYSDLKNKISDTLSDISNNKVQVQQAEVDLENEKQAHEKVLATQQVVQGQIVSDVVDQQATLQQLNDELGKLQSQLSSLLGSNFSTDDILKAAKIASNATGVSKDFILGELVVESDLGRFTGGCTYDKSKMGTANLAVFKSIASSLGYNYKNLKVSCALSYGIGGAMGIAQFMPTTWVGYESRISSATGHKPPDPWNLVDGITGMAIKLDNDGGGSKSGEKNAAARYYCGGNISRAICQNYAKKVLYWSDNYDQLLGNN